jgi:hypothetical protein
MVDCTELDANFCFSRRSAKRRSMKIISHKIIELVFYSIMFSLSYLDLSFAKSIDDSVRDAMKIGLVDGKISVGFEQLRNLSTNSRELNYEVALLLWNWNEKRRMNKLPTLPHASYTVEWLECAAAQDMLNNKVFESSAIPLLEDVFTAPILEGSTTPEENVYGVKPSPQLAKCWKSVYSGEGKVENCIRMQYHSKALAKAIGQLCPPKNPTVRQLKMLDAN